MPSISPQLLATLQSYTKNIRNICVLAHVDHGKTTLSDCLISSNGIISQQMAGKLRYLDFLESEQERLITMKASSISLLYQQQDTSSTPAPSQEGTDNKIKVHNYLINLIDSPGHVDFSSEVSTAVRITDGALVLVDAVEGVCIQTHAVLRQAYQEKVKPCLVINKIDRLVTELHMTPLEAYQHMKKVIEQVNAITGTLSSEEIILKEIDQHEKSTASPNNSSSTSGEQTTDDVTESTFESMKETVSEYHFSPDKGNVAFTTAFDGWGFTIQQFVDLCHKKTGIKKDILQKVLWGDYYYHPKEKKIYKSPKGNLTPMFVTFILNSIWEVYKTITPEYIDREKLDKIMTLLNLKINPRDLASKDSKILLCAVLQSWLPLSEAVLSMVVDRLPNPIEGQSRRMDKILQLTKQTTSNATIELDDEFKEKQQTILKQTKECDKSNDIDVLAYVAKVFINGEKGVTTTERRAVPPRRVQPSTVPTRLKDSNENNNINVTPTTPNPTTAPTTTTPNTNNTTENPIPTLNTLNIRQPLVMRQQPQSDKEKDTDEFIAVVRVFSGTLKKGKKVYIMGPRFDPLNPTHDIHEIEITHLYLLMGRSLEPIDQVPAGNVCGVGGGIGGLVLKSATISTTLKCPTIVNMMFVSSPIVKVAVQPENIIDMPKLVHGLKMLNQADPLVEVYVQESGEHVIVASGELHLERCIDDLKSFSKINVNVSSPIVPFRETIINDSKVIQQQQTAGSPLPVNYDLIKQSTANRMVKVHVRAVPLPSNITEFLEQHSNAMRDLYLGGKKKESIASEKGSKKEATVIDREEFQKKLKDEFEKAGDQWALEYDRIWAFGPKHIGPNILLNRIPGYTSNSEFWIPATKRGIQSLKKSKLIHQHINEDEQEEDKEEKEEEDNEEKNNNEGEEQEEKEKEVEDDEEDKSVSTNNNLVQGQDKFKRIFELDNSIVSGFQLASFAGPLSEEPMMGVCMVIEDIEFVDGEYNDNFGPISGQLISTVKEACRSAFQAKPQRLMEALYLCEIQVSSTALGKMYSVLAARRAQIIKEGMKEGTPIFCIQARLPVAESFGFSQQIMIKTSGAASTQLFFDNHWEVMEQDPYFQLSTEEELEDHGVNVASLGNNIARQYMDKIRKRKGLPVEEKLVVHGDKQRTLKKNK